jgi:hypothetical protein
LRFPLLLVTTWVALVAPATGGDLLVWRLRDARLEVPAGAPRGALPVGSLQKPFVARAWADTHRGQATPRLACSGGASCWYRPGHGSLGLVQAVSLSCNAYFRELAAQVPRGALATALREAGFRVEEPLSESEAIGIDPLGKVAIQPGLLLAAYLRLVREPWTTGESVRQELRAGLRSAALHGTARAFRDAGAWAKTGTSASVLGQPLATSGWVVAIDDAGRATLGLLPRGTGRTAAEQLAAGRVAIGPIAERALSGAPDRVTVELFALLAPRGIVARNLSPAPLSTSFGFIGPGATRPLRGGDRLGEGTWQLEIAERRLERVVHASLACEQRADGTLRLRATLSAREYVGGVIAAELPAGSRGLRVALGAAALRFLGRGPRHAGADVCDSTHCAYFVGRGPRLDWSAAATAGASGPGFEPPDDALWREIVTEAVRPGPSQWTSHCGGAPLSAHYVWGSSDRSVSRCRLHDAGDTRPWTRFLSDAAVADAFGPGVRGLRVVESDGVWTLLVDTPEATRRMLYDEAHRLLARALDWGALPSPATRVVRESGGFRAEGVGLGHRVGLCLGEMRGYANIAALWPPPKHP